MIIKITFQDLMKISGRTRMAINRDALALLGPIGHRIGALKREIPLDDAFGVFLVGLLVDAGVKVKEAAERTRLIMQVVDGVGLTPSKVFASGQMPDKRLVVRLYPKQKVYGFVVYDELRPRATTDGQGNLRVDDGAGTLKIWPKRVKWEDLPGPFYTIDVTAHVIDFMSLVKDLG
jgi:hypothetical protein